MRSLLLSVLVRFVAGVVLAAMVVVLVAAAVELWLFGQEADVFELPFRGLYLIANTAPFSLIALVAIGVAVAAGAFRSHSVA